MTMAGLARVGAITLPFKPRGAQVFLLANQVVHQTNQVGCTLVPKLRFSIRRRKAETLGGEVT